MEYSKHGSGWRAEMAGIIGFGRTKKDALEEIEKQVAYKEKVSASSSAPIFIGYKNAAVVIHWLPNYGWSYDIFGLDGGALKEKRLFGSCTINYNSKEATLRSARHHLAQFVFEWWGETGETVVQSDPELHQELLSYIRWQYAYKFCREKLDMDDQSARYSIDAVCALETFEQWVRGGLQRIPWKEE